MARREQGAAVVAVPVAALAGLSLTLLLIAAVTASTADSTNCLPAQAPQAVVDVTTESQLDLRQRANARIVVQTAADLRLPPAAARVGVAVAMQESRLRNLSWGDRDSLGLFQQRGPWGSAAARTHPRTAALMFYAGGQGGQRGLTNVPGWTSMPLTRADQAVQRSATPEAYEQWTALATDVVNREWNRAETRAASADTRQSTPAALSAAPEAPCTDWDADATPGAASTHAPRGLVINGSPAGQRAARFALAQLGKPYVWGAAGPDAYDCSGLTSSAWGAAGVSLPHFTGAQAMAGRRVAGGLTHALAGDLVLIPGSHGTTEAPRHVGIVVGYAIDRASGRRTIWLVNAPRSGRPVQSIDAQTWAGKIAGLRHIA